MSREIKYRVWDENKGEYRTDYEEMVLYPDGTFQIETSWCIISGEFVVEQYTGLKDKNDKEIYEGDIVKWLDGLDEYIAFQVEWQENRARFCLRNQYSHFDYEDLNDKKKPYIEVISNIHENPELLGGENETN